VSSEAEARERELRALAITVTRELWPDVEINEAHVTPEFATYVFMVQVAATEGHHVVKSLVPALGLATSWIGVSVKLVNAIRTYMSQRQDWGMAIRAAVAVHRRHVQSYLNYGPEVYVLQFR
jgi:hypothetical protein